MRYGCQSWGQSFNTRDIEKLQNKTINIINFKTGSLHLNNQLKTVEILKLKDLIFFNNIPFVFDQLKEDLPQTFKSYFLIKFDYHIYIHSRKTISINTHRTKKTLLDVPLKNTSQYGTNLITSRSIFNWNDMDKKIECSLEISQRNFIILLKACVCYFLSNFYFFIK